MKSSQYLSHDRRAGLAYVLPLVVFLGFLFPFQLSGWPFWEHPNAPWWRQHPEQWQYPIQTLLTLGVLYYFRKSYQWRWSWWVVVSMLCGGIGILFWLLPTMLYDRMPDFFAHHPDLQKWGFAARTEGGFNPYALVNSRENPLLFYGGIVLRCVRAVFVVALAEEIFWRGFLMRYVLSQGGDWRTVPFGKASWLSYGVVTALFIFSHNPIDYLGAWFYGSLAYLLAVFSKNLLSCVVMHATANALMIGYAFSTGKWGLL